MNQSRRSVHLEDRHGPQNIPSLDGTRNHPELGDSWKVGLLCFSHRGHIYLTPHEESLVGDISRTSQEGSLPGAWQGIRATDGPRPLRFCNGA